MYNEKRKEEFIKEAIKSNAKLESIYKKRFTESMEMENKLDKDLCEWNVNEVLNLYKFYVGRSLETLMMVHSQFRRYADWCLTHSFIPDSQNHFEEIDREILRKECVNQAYLDVGIVTREELLEMITNNENIANPYESFLVLAIFEGIDGSKYQDLRNLTMDDFNGNEVRLPSRTLIVSDELVYLARKSSETYTYIAYGSVCRDWDFDEDDKRIIKNKKGSRNVDAVSYNHKLALNLQRISNRYASPVFTRAMLHESGRIEFINNIIRKEHVDADTVIRKHKEEINIRYGNIYNVPRYCDKWSEFLINPKNI